MWNLIFELAKNLINHEYEMCKTLSAVQSLTPYVVITGGYTRVAHALTLYLIRLNATIFVAFID